MYEYREHYFQKCSYITEEGQNWKPGIAKLSPNVGLGISDIEFIINTNGNKVEKVYDYSLCNIEFNNIHVAIVLEGK